MSHSRTAAQLPPTVNLHLVAHCNMKCQYCYARFVDERSARALDVAALEILLAQLARSGARRITFAGGEPTLHQHLGRLLRRTSALGMVTSIVTNASRIDAAWLHEHGPWLRWLTLSIDSVEAPRTLLLGRAARNSPPHLARIREVAQLVHAFNALRPASRRIRLKINITVTSLNADEDPTALIRELAPEKVKVLQMLLVDGENDGPDGSTHLVCSDRAFGAYVARVGSLAAHGIDVVGEDNDAMDGSYAMIDPLGRFFQRVSDRYVRSRPILEAGVMEAWADVGGFDAGAFTARGGDYDAGLPANGNAPYSIEIEGLDGTGKTTVVRALAAALDGVLISNPPIPRPEGFVAWTEADQRRWYAARNRDALELARAATAAGRVAILDRGIASTLVFAHARAGAPDAALAWPEDCSAPDLLLVLDVPEAERRRRLVARGDALTMEEQLGLDDASFRERVARGYRALGATFVPAGGTPDEVLAAVLALLRAA